MSTAKITAPTISGLGGRRFVLPVSIVSDWVDVCVDPANLDNESGVMSGGAVVNPSAISRSTQSWLQIAGIGTIVQVRLKYPTSGSVAASPVVQVFGRDRLQFPQRLVDAGGVHALPLTVDAAGDVRDGQFSYTQPVEVDADGCAEVIAAVRTALTGTGLSGATIQARVK
jgi:hypothetical protein